MLNHGGTEMGQGLYVKVAQVVAAEFGIAPGPGEDHRDQHGESAEHVAHRGVVGQRHQRQGGAGGGARRSASAWPAWSPTAFGVPAETLVFADGMVRGGGEEMTFAEAAKLTHRARVSLSSTGYYRTPKIHYDATTHRGRPFYYFAYGAAVSEVEIDTLTGEYRLRRVDILHDCGASLNPALDLGQIEGGFVQGMGWLTSEELWWDANGRLRTHAPSTYKIPACGDVPAAFNVAIYTRGPQCGGHRSIAPRRWASRR